MAGYINVGLDFGSLNHRAAYIANQKIIPIPANDALIWGGNLQLLQTGTDFQFTSLKSQIGSGQTAFFGGEKKSVEDIILSSFKGMKHKIEEFAGEPIRWLTIAIPARYSSFRRTELLSIVAKAGFEQVSFINDTIAAAQAYTFGQDTSSTFLIYSMGYTGYEISLIRVAKQNLRELAHDGNDTPAGGVFDATLMDLCLNLLKQRKHPQASLLDPLYLQKKQIVELSNLVTHIKHALSEGDMVCCDLSTQNQNTLISFSFTRTQFESLVTDQILATMESVDHLLEEASMQYSDVDQVLLLGGSTHIATLRHQLEARFGPRLVALEDDILARGAALQANKMENQETVLSTPPSTYPIPSPETSTSVILVTTKDTEVLSPSAGGSAVIADPLQQRYLGTRNTPGPLLAEPDGQKLSLAIDIFFDQILTLAQTGGEQQADDLLTLLATRVNETLKTLAEARQSR